MSLLSHNNDEKYITKLTSIALHRSRKTDSDFLTSVKLGAGSRFVSGSASKWNVGSGYGSALKGLGHWVTRWIEILLACMID